MDSEIPELSDEAEEHVKLENGDEVINARAPAGYIRRKRRKLRCCRSAVIFGGLPRKIYW